MPVENAIITHGHADHARAGHQKVLATQNTIDIMKIRYGHRCANSFQSLEYHKPLKINDLTITFYPAGHILGSAQILIENTNDRLLITGSEKRLDHLSFKAEGGAITILPSKSLFFL